MTAHRIITAEEALRLAQYQRPGARLIVGPELACEIQLYGTVAQ